MLDNTRAELTKAILLSISYHLSHNKDNRYIEYIVTIDDNSIVLDMSTRCYRYEGSKRINQRVPVIHHVIVDHFNGKLWGVGSGNKVKISDNILEPGIYQYKRSASGKSRKWFKVR